MHDLTLRQIEVIRAVMLTGTISGAAGLLNVSAPGISRLVKHAEETLGIRLFERKAGVFIPSVEASRVFDQVREVYRQVESLNAAVSSLKCGEDVRLSRYCTFNRTIYRCTSFAERKGHVRRLICRHECSKN